MRPLDAAILAELEADHHRIRYFGEFHFDGGIERLWTGLGSITTLSQTWTGVGSLASIEGLEEGIELSPYALKLALSRLDATYSNLAINEDFHNRPAILRISAVDATGALVAAPGIVFSGEMIEVEATVGNPESGEIIILTCENELARLDRSANLRYTDTQLQSEFSGDLGLEYLDQIADHESEWRGKAVPLGGAPAPATDESWRSRDR